MISRRHVQQSLFRDVYTIINWLFLVVSFIPQRSQGRTGESTAEHRVHEEVISAL